MSEILFSPQVLNSRTTLEQFFSEDKEIQEIAKTQTEPSLLNGRWEFSSIPPVGVSIVCHGVRAYISVIEMIFLSIGKFVVSNLGLTDLSQRISVVMNHEGQPINTLLTYWVYNENFLAASANTYRLGTEDIYLQPQLNAILPGQTQARDLKFSYRGVCYGESLWFIYLYFKTAGYFNNPESHLKAICRQFERGASRQAGLLQTLAQHYVGYRPSLYSLLRLNGQENFRSMTTEGRTREQMIQHLQALPLGVYCLGGGRHAMVYIKHSQNQHFLFDPNDGIINVSDPAIFKRALNPYRYKHAVLVDKFTSF